MALVALGVAAAVTHDRLMFLIAPRAAVGVAAGAGGVLRAAGAGDDKPRRARVALCAADLGVRSGRQHEAGFVRVEPGREIGPGVVAGLAVGVEVRGDVIERGERGVVVVLPVAGDAGERRLREGPIAHVAVALATGNQRVLAGQGKGGAPVRIGTEQRLRPARRFMTTLAVKAELPGVAVAVAAAAELRDPGPKSGRVAGLAGHLRVSADERVAGAIVVESHFGPARFDVASGAAAGGGPLAEGRARDGVRRPAERGRPLARRRGLAARRRAEQDRERGEHQIGGGPHGSKPLKSPWWKSRWHP